MSTQPARGASLRFRGVSRDFSGEHGPVRAVADVDLDVAPGSFVALVGPSGCGKSTLLNIAAGLDTGYTGTLDVAPTPVRRAYLFQSPRLLPWATALRNVAFVLESTGTPRGEARARAQAALELVGLGDAVDRYPGHLSGGMRQRVALARALVVEPDLMLMDEPFAAVDQFTARRLRRELVAIHAAEPRTVLFVTHDISEAVLLADRVVVLRPHPGTVVAEVDVDLARPRDEDDPALATLSRQVSQALADHLPPEPGHHAGPARAARPVDPSLDRTVDPAVDRTVDPATATEVLR